MGEPMKCSFLLVAGLLFLGLGGCSGDDDACVVPDPTLDSLNERLFSRSCTISNSCHTGSNPEPVFIGADSQHGHMDLTQPEDLCNLIDRPSITDEQGRPLITCGSCADSYMMIKLDPARASEITTSTEYEDEYDGETSAMPQGSRGVASKALCQPKIDVLCAWIDQGCAGCACPTCGVGEQCLNNECIAGNCSDDCRGNACCDGGCVDLRTDPGNCGSCGTTCECGKLCDGGRCVSIRGHTYTDCGGECIETGADPAHCGDCDTVCAPGETCSRGACR
jgi:stigma-specific protein Stig1